MISQLKQHAAACALWLLFAGGASAACVDSDRVEARLLPAIGAEASEDVVARRSGRMVVPVRVNGAGPFRFILDTGANRSVLSTRLAGELGLAPEGAGEVHSVHGVTVAPLAEVDTLHFGDLSLTAARSLPVMEGPVLAGEAGLLGVDGLRDRRLRMDFENDCIEISPSAPSRRRNGWTRLEGDLRFGHLILVDGRIRDQPIRVLLDTGSDSTLANQALGARLGAGVRLDHEVTIRARAFTAGTPIVLDTAVLIPEISMGGVNVHNITAYVGDFHIFDLWGLTDEPALLIGMDVLAQTRALVIDYGEGTVDLRLRRPPRTGTRLNDTGQRVTVIR